MLTAAIISQLETAWNSPIVLATKKDGSTRFCIDFRKINGAIKSNKWPVPNVEEIFEDLRVNNIFTTLDLFQGYWQAKMDETCMEKTAFVCNFGSFQFEFMRNVSENDG